jgi:hypothetical protein
VASGVTEMFNDLRAAMQSDSWVRYCWARSELIVLMQSAQVLIVDAPAPAHTSHTHGLFVQVVVWVKKPQTLRH